MLIKSTFHFGFICCALLALTNCSPTRDVTSAGGKPLKVLATTTLVEDMIHQTLGDLVEVDVLMGPGVDPHLYVVSTRDYAKIKAAKVVVFSGLRFESKLADTLATMTKSKEVIDLSSFLPRERIIVNSQRQPDPHYWFDPEMWLAAGEGFARRMQAIMPQNKILIRESFSRWRRAINESTNFARDQFRKVPADRRVLVTSHDGFEYYARFFDLEVMSVMGASTVAQISIAKIEAIAKSLKSRKIPAVYTEASISPYAIQKVQEESGARLGGELYGDALGAPDTVASTYVGMLKHNASVFVEGFDPKSKVPTAVSELSGK